MQKVIIAEKGYGKNLDIERRFIALIIKKNYKIVIGNINKKIGDSS